MAFANNDNNFKRLITIQRSAGVNGFGLLALTVADPNGSVTPTAGYLGMATDYSLWKANGVTWELVSGASGSTQYDDDVTVTFGNNATASQNYVLELDTSSGRRFWIRGAADYSGVAGVITATPDYTVQVPSATVTDAAVGPNGGTVTITAGSTLAGIAGATGGTSGGLILQSGATDTVAGATGGDSGNVFLRSGAASSTGGAGSGSTGDVTVQSGSSADADSGDVIFRSGTAGDDSGTVTIASGTGVDTGLVTIGSGNGTATSGDVILASGSGVTDTGNVLIATGVSTGSASGSVTIATSGGVSTFDSGNITVATGAIDVATAVAGGDSGSITIVSGAIDTDDAGATGGTSGAVTFGSGDAASTVGAASGDTGLVTVKSGTSADGASGDIAVTVGPAPNTGDVLVTIPAGGTTTGECTVVVGVTDASFTSTGFIPPAYQSATTQTAANVTLTLRFVVTVAGTQAVAMAFAGVVIGAALIKTGGAGVAGDTLDLRTTSGSVLPSVTDLNGVANGAYVAVPAFNTTVANRAFTAGQSISVVAVEGGGSVDCEAYITVLRTA